MSTVGNNFEKIKTKYESCPDFCDIYAIMTDGLTREVDGYTLHDGYLFLDRKLCIQESPLGNFFFENCMLVVSLGIREWKDRRSHWVSILLARTEIWCCQSSRKNTCLYTPLPISNCPWQDVSMNSVLGLLKTLRKHDSVLVVMDRFSKMAHFLPCSRTFDASRVAKIFFDGVVKLHGLPKTIVSDSDVKFISYFWKTLWHMLDKKLKFSNAFHSQTDGQTRVINRSLGNTLCTLVDVHIGS